MRFSDLKRIKAEPPHPAPPSHAAKVKKTEAPPPQPERKPEQAPPGEPAAPQKQEGRRRAPGPRLMNSRGAPAPLPHPSAPPGELQALAKEVYSRLLAQTDSFLAAIDQPYCEKYETLLSISALVVETLRTNPFILSCTAYSTADDYLRGHTANTAILSLAMGLEAGFGDKELGLLGFCALAHDIGMTEYSTLYNSEARLTEKEFSEMSLHVESGAAKLDRIVDIDYKVKERVRRVILQTHERPDGLGYPDHAQEEEPDPLARIIGVADAYEVITHPRAWRPAVFPQEAIKEIIEKEGRGFNSGAVKLLVSAISIYPPGSLVHLSNGETARVSIPNKGLLSRPLVEIVLDPDFSQVEPHLTNLKDHPLVSIERGLNPAEVEERNPKYAALLELSLWWKDW